MVYSSIRYIIYPATHIGVIVVCRFLPFLTSPTTTTILDTVLFPLDALLRTSAITRMVSMPTPPTCSPRNATFAHLFFGAFISSSCFPSFPTYPLSDVASNNLNPALHNALMRTSNAWILMEYWAGALVVVVYDVVSGAPAFHGMQWFLRLIIVGVAGIKEDSCVVGTPWLSVLEAKALAASVLVVCYGVRAYKALYVPAVPAKPWEKNFKGHKTHKCDNGEPSASASKRQRL